jgi:hypothetical protein
VEQRLRRPELLSATLRPGVPGRRASRWTAVVERLTPDFPRIIPGNWGKAGSGWLAQPLGGRIARFGRGGRIHQFL